jgi:hypothetical protein
MNMILSQVDPAYLGDGGGRAFFFWGVIVAVLFVGILTACCVLFERDR